MGYSTTYEITAHFYTTPHAMREYIQNAITLDAFDIVAVLASEVDSCPDPTEVFIAVLNTVTTRHVPIRNGMNTTSWDYVDDIRTVMALNIFSDITVVIDGRGEDDDDIWRHKFTNGGDEKIAPELIWPEWSI
jgi:hypothetical protein